MQNIIDTLQDLPIADILTDVIDHTEDGSVAIVASETSSGKTLLIPSMLQFITEQKVLVLEPRRLLAINAAETLAELSETDVGTDIGFAVGSIGRVENGYDPRNNKIVYATYGYALKSPTMLADADIIILDEVHEPSMDITIIKALLKRRMESDTPLDRLILMSATLNVENEVEYWNDYNPKVFTAERKQRFACDRRWEPATPPWQAAMKLLSDGHKGILVFVPGIADIRHTEQDIQKALLEYTLDDVELASIHGQDDYALRRTKLAAPTEGWTKILIGTDILESGVNLPWVDAGVSCGVHKEFIVARHSGAISLRPVPMTKSNVDQQAGRTNRFRDSRFILCGQLSYEEMAKAPTPEILRLPLTALYLHCVSLGIDPHELEFSPAPDYVKLAEAAVKLQRLGFLDTARQLTDDGIFAQSLPVGLETAALLCHARRIGILGEALILAAVFEVGDVRKDGKLPHGYDNTSDLFDSARAFALGRSFARITNRQKRNEAMVDANIGRKKYDDVVDVLYALEQSLNYEASNHGPYLPESQPYQGQLFDQLRQCVLAASLNRLGSWHLSGTIRTTNSSWISYRPTNATAVYQQATTVPVAVSLLEITPHGNGRPFTVGTNITCFTVENIERFAKERPGVFSFFNTDFDTEISVFGMSFFRAERRTEVLRPDVVRGAIDFSSDTTTRRTMLDLYTEGANDALATQLRRDLGAVADKTISEIAARCAVQQSTIPEPPLQTAEVKTARQKLAERFGDR